MKKILSLLTMLVTATSLFAATETLFYWKYDGSTTALNSELTATGGTVKLATTDASKAWTNENATYNSAVTGDFVGPAKGLKAGGNVLYIELTLTTGNFQAGDKIEIVGYNPWLVSLSNEARGEVSGASGVATGTGNKDYNVGSVVIPTGVSTNKLYLRRQTGSGTGIAVIKITRSDDPTLTASTEKLAFALNPGKSSQSEKFILTGQHLTDGTYPLTVPEVAGLSVEPASFTVTDGKTEQEFTVTYASTEDVAKATAQIKAAVGETVTTVDITYQSRTAVYTQNTISEAATWDWSKLSETVELTDETSPKKTDEFLLADLDDRINFTETFGNPKAIKMEGMQYPARAGYAQGTTIKLKTAVPGTIAVDFSNTGSSRPYRYLNVNGVNTEFKDNAGTKQNATGISVPAGEIVLKGYIPDATDPQTKEGDVVGDAMLRWYKIVFTPKAADATFDFANNPNNWPVSTAVFGDEVEAAKVTELTVANVKLTSIQNNEFNSNFIYKNGDAAPAFRVFRENAFKLTAPEGKAIVGVSPTMAAATFDLEADNGIVADEQWAGNATEVTFTAAAIRLIASINVYLADENEETIKTSAANVEAANIAEFNDVEDGKIVKLTLTNAKVNGVNGGSAYVEDASGATVIKGVSLTAGTALNGYIIGTKSTNNTIDYVNDPVVAVEYQLTATDASTFEATETTLTGTVMTGAEAAAQANYGRLITLENVEISGTGQNKTLTVDGTYLSIKARDYMSVLPTDYTWPEKASKITGVVIYYMTGWFILPISADAIVAKGEQPTEATFDFASESIRENIGTGLTDVKGYIYNETFTAENVTLQITGGSAPSRIYKDTNRGQNLVTYKEYTTLTFKAPENYAITKIEFTAAGNSNINNFNASSGTIEGMTWTGNVDGVRFAQGGTSYLAKAVVTLAAKTTETAALPAIEYTECANIAAFNALAAGTYAKVTLTDAEVTGVSADGYSTVFIQDATGGCWIQYTSLNDKLKEKTKVNGTVYVVARPNSGNVQMKEAEDTPKSEITATDISDYTIVEGTLAEVNVAANLNKVVKITGAELTETSDTAGKLKQGDATIDVNNGAATDNQQLHKIAEWTNGTNLENVTIVAILVGKSATANQLLPISMEATATGIENINADITNGDVKIYNLQGVRLNKLQKGVNIVNGRKVVIK